MRKQLKQFKAKARALARSGQFYGWAPLEFELSFQVGYGQGRAWLNEPATREELNRICSVARARFKAKRLASEAA
jgi:hypothetical protein